MEKFGSKLSLATGPLPGPWGRYQKSAPLKTPYPIVQMTKQKCKFLALTVFPELRPAVLKKGGFPYLVAKGVVHSNPFEKSLKLMVHIHVILNTINSIFFWILTLQESLIEGLNSKLSILIIIIAIWGVTPLEGFV